MEFDTMYWNLLDASCSSSNRRTFKDGGRVIRVSSSSPGRSAQMQVAATIPWAKTTLLGQPRKEVAMAEPTKPLLFVLTNQKSQALTLISEKVVGQNGKLDLPQTLGHGTIGGFGLPGSPNPYEALWSFSPDGGKTLLNFD